MAKYSKWNSIPNNLKAISALAIFYPILILLVWIITLAYILTSKVIPLAYITSQINFDLIFSYALSLLVMIIIPFFICLFIARGIKKQENWARKLLILLSLIIFIKEIPLLIELLTTSVEFTFPTLIIIIPSLLKLSGSAGIIISLFRKRIKEVFK